MKIKRKRPGMVHLKKEKKAQDVCAYLDVVAWVCVSVGIRWSY